MQNTSSNYITVVEESCINSNDCLSFYMPVLSDFKIENEFNIKKQQEKVNILKEILSSEKKYLNDIKEIVEGYYEEIQKHHDDEFIYHIFSNIKEIYEFTKSFYSMLEASTNDEVGISNCFIKKHKTFTKLYSVYCQNYKLAFSSSEKLEKDPHIGKIIQKVRVKYGHCLKMATYLQLPVLRITKYHLLLQRYLKLLQKDSFAYNQVLEALELMRQVNDQINREMPEQDMDSNNENVSNCDSIQELIGLFGKILKQGSLILNETKKMHHVIVFQTMIVIKYSTPSSKIMHSISNDYLAFVPSPSPTKSRCFTLIDYSQSKGDQMRQLTLKAKSYEDKQAWQSAILSSVLNGYGKKVPENAKNKVMDVEIENKPHNESLKSNNDFIKKKMTTFKRLADFRYSLKNDFKKAPKPTGLSSDLAIEDKSKNHLHERRLSMPLNQSRFVKILDKTLNTEDLANKTNLSDDTKILDKPKDERIERLLSKFRREKTDRSKKPRLDSSVSRENEKFNIEPVNNDKLNVQVNENEPVEISRNNYEKFYKELDHSFNEVAGTLEENILSHYEKLLNEKNKNVNEASIEKKIYESIKSSKHKVEPGSFNAYRTRINNRKDSTALTSSSSQTSLNSEEGYYSNHDSSISAVGNQNQYDINSMLKPEQRTLSTPELLKQSDLSAFYKTFEENFVFSNDYNSNDNSLFPTDYNSLSFSYKLHKKESSDESSSNRSKSDHSSSGISQDLKFNAQMSNDVQATIKSSVKSPKKSSNFIAQLKSPILNTKLGRNLNSSLLSLNKYASKKLNYECKEEENAFDNKKRREILTTPSGSQRLKPGVFNSFTRIKSIQTRFQDFVSKNDSKSASTFNLKDKPPIDEHSLSMNKANMITSYNSVIDVNKPTSSSIRKNQKFNLKSSSNQIYLSANKIDSNVYDSDVDMPDYNVKKLISQFECKRTKF